MPKRAATTIEPCYRALGARITFIREALGLRQADLARKLGWHRATVANIEVGRQRVLLHDIETIATALGTTARGLLKGVYP